MMMSQLVGQENTIEGSISLQALWSDGLSNIGIMQWPDHKVFGFHSAGAKTWPINQLTAISQA